MISIERITEKTRPFINKQIAEGWGGPNIVTKCVVHDTRTCPGFIAAENGEIRGYVLYNIADGNLEIIILESLCENKGIGRALINAVIEVAKEAVCHRVWLITTNDNTHAIRFYQRFGFFLRDVHINAVAEARKLKPQIPLIGYDGIPLNHEFEFEIIL